MKTQYKRMVETRRLYKLEGDLYGKKKFREITKQQSLTTLQQLARKIWKEEGCKKQLPEIRFGKGTNHGPSYYSWCDGETIELAPKQRDILTLIHELAHAMGHDYHNKPFVMQELLLLMKYTPLDTELLEITFQPVIDLCY